LQCTKQVSITASSRIFCFINTNSLFYEGSINEYLLQREQAKLQPQITNWQISVSILRIFANFDILVSKAFGLRSRLLSGSSIIILCERERERERDTHTHTLTHAHTHPPPLCSLHIYLPVIQFTEMVKKQFHYRPEQALRVPGG
jgi:hypothetical protein